MVYIFGHLPGPRIEIEWIHAVLNFE
jgi:hypothetical protein